VHKLVKSVSTVEKGVLGGIKKKGDTPVSRNYMVLPQNVSL